MKNLPFDNTDLTWLGRLARALLQEPHAADDLVQETVVAALEGPIPAGAPPRAWLGSVARRLAARRFRGESRRARREKAVARPEALPDSSELMERAEVAEWLTAAARRLPEPFRRTILLHFLEGLSPEMIAGKEGKKADTVRWRLRRGLVLLREELMRSHDRDWSSWSVLLLPMARSGGDVSLSATSESAMGASSVASLIALKTTWILLAMVVLCGTSLLFRWGPWRGQDREPVLGRGVPSVTTLAANAATDVDPGFPRDEASSRPAITPGTIADGLEAGVEQPVERNATPVPGLFGKVVSEIGDPVAGATVYLVPSVSDAEPGRSTKTVEILARTESDARGRFFLPEEDWQEAKDLEARALDLGVIANGFMRRLMTDAPSRQPPDGFLVILERGGMLSGRVVDEFGVAVPDLELLTHTEGAGVSHVSPSQVRLRAECAALGDSRSRYEQCRARTDENGEVVFRGLPVGELTVRSLDPAWTLEDPVEARADSSFLIWTAKRRLGVFIAVVDARTGRPVQRASATFRARITFADGQIEDYGQWVGRGQGGVSFVLGPNLPQLADRIMTRADFYGTVRSGETEIPWEAESLVDSRGVTGVAEVRVEIDPSAELAAGDQPEEKAPPTVDLELEVSYSDKTPFEGRLVVQWTCRLDEGSVRKGSVRSESTTPGHYRIPVPAGDLALRISELNASGSLSPWTGKLRCDADRPARAFVTLPRGATVTIVRPEEWNGEWFVHASWRSTKQETWRGSWIYSTVEETLFLSALRSAEWRFRLGRDAKFDVGPMVRIVRLSEWNDVVVD